jgi:inosine-uridine nucleoside N-ribohydrolase
LPAGSKDLLMGGAVSSKGIFLRLPEANIYHDAHAADIVLQASCPVVMVG